MEKISIFDHEKVEEFRKENKLQPYKIKQIYHEIFGNANIEFDDMTTLSKELRTQLAERFYILDIKIDKTLEGSDTTKFSFKTKDGNLIETVIMMHFDKKGRIDTINRLTLCISCQVGCPVGCIFCVTGKLGLKRNLSHQEIIGQLMYANNYIKKKFGKKEDGSLNKIRNVVFMGMGEPLLNFENMKKSIDMMLAQANGFSLSKRHITISTSGVIPGIQRLIDEDIEVMLAISLHSPNQLLRKDLIPIGQKFELDGLMDVIYEYVRHTGNRIFYEYIMIKDLTDTPELAKELADLLTGQLCHVNLIAYNENPAMPELKESPESNIQKFKHILETNGITVTIRDSLGRDLKGACGQLGYEKINEQQEF